MFVVSTSHMDWDWNVSFGQYYFIGIPSASIDNPISPVRAILDKAISLMQDVSNPGYQFNLAEIAWLKRYLLDNPTLAPQLALLENKFFFLGGGITSPDNLVCNGEAFIRNYLTGRNYVKSIGLVNLLTDVCWIPDDFGQDPQLPVVLNAMGMKAVSF
jgi:alpha-mannosidase